MDEQVELAINTFRQAVAPLVQLLVRQGVTYPKAADALRAAFIAAAEHELAGRGMKPTGSAVSLLSGVHRKDLRLRARQAEAREVGVSAPAVSLIGEVAARWMSHRTFKKAGQPKPLKRGDGPGSFDALVQGVTRDVGPRAVLDEMLRLNIAHLDGEHITLQPDAMVPRGDAAAMHTLAAANLHDHAAAVCANLSTGTNFLEQALYVDGITAASAEQLHQVATKAWQAAFAKAMPAAQTCFDHDQAQAHPDERQARVRFGVYFFSEPGTPAEPEPNAD